MLCSADFRIYFSDQRRSAFFYYFSLAIKSIDEYTDKEKIEFFDKLYRSALAELKELEEKGYSSEYNQHYAWEEYIKILAKDRTTFWEYWNSFDN